MRSRAPSLTSLKVRLVHIPDALEIDELDRVAVRVVKIGMPAREAAVALVLVEQHFDAAGFHMRERGVEILARKHEGVVDEGVAALVRGRVIVSFRKHEILLAATHEDGRVIAAPEGRPD